MKKYITYLLATALVGSAFVSCTNRLQEGEMRHPTHKVHFSAADVETRTGLSIDGTTVTPDWNKTETENIHLFEIDANDAVAYGETIAITTSEDKATAHFEADFPTDMSIIVDPSDPEEDSGAKGASNGAIEGPRVSPYRYAAIIAQKPDKNNLTFVVPSEQHPDAVTLKDPDADFLIGYSRKAYDTEHFFDEPVVDLYFDRAAALGRLAISNFAEGEKVQSVTINAQNGLTGCASYADIDFENGSVSFVREEGPGILTLVYDGGMDIPADGPFYAYFVAIPGSATLTSVEVVTDHYRYTKTIEGGKELTFSEKAFKSINLDLSTATREEVAPSGLTWYKASVLEDGIDYLIVSAGQALKNNDGATAGVSVTDNEGVITLEAADPTIVWTTAYLEALTDREPVVVAGHFTLSNDGLYLQRYTDDDNNGHISIDDVPENKKYYVWDYDGTYLKHASSGSNTFYCYYNNGWVTSYTKDDAVSVEIYTTRLPQEISFPEGPFEYDLDAGEEFVEPSLTGEPIGNVTYSSSDESIATVASDGNVTFLKVGQVVITATASGDDKHQAASASYVITISSSSVTTWYKAEEVENNGIYMVVSNGNALNLDGTSISTVSNNEFSGASFQYEANDNLKWTATVSTDGQFTLKNGSRYLSRSSGNIQTSSSGASLSYDSENNYVTTKGSNSTYYIYYSGGWKASTTKDNATLYTVKQPRNLAFASNKVTHDLADGDDVNEPELEGVKTGVTYKSSNVEVATVDASTGVVNLTGTRGYAKITATAEKTETLQGGSASYTLKVTDSRIPNKTYKKITSTGDLVVGTQYLLVFEGLADDTDGDGDPKVFLPISASSTTFSKSQDNALEVAISNNTIVSNEFDYCHLTLESGYYLKSDKVGSYLYPTGTSSAGGSLSAEATASNALSISFDNGIAQIKTTSGSYYLVWSTSSHYFSSNTSVSGQYSTGICLYKLEDGRQPQTLSFSSSTATYDLADPSSFEKPSLSTAYGDVTYSSSDKTIAEVDDLGNITGKKKGTVTITATAAGDNQYKPGSASYTLKITNSSVTTPIWRKADAIEAGETYLIVSNGYALQNNGGSAAAVAVTVSDGVIEFDAPDNAIFTATASSSNFTLQNDGQYMQRGGSSGSYVPTFSSSQSSYYQWTYSSADEYVTAKGNSTYYVYYSTGNSKWSMSTSSGSSHKTALYKLDDGSNPGGGDNPEPPTPSTSTYSRISFATGITTGNYLIVNPSDAQVFTTVTSYPNSTSVTSSDGVISGDYSSSEVTITKNGDNYTIQNANGQYLYYVYTSGDTQTRVAYKSDTENWAAGSVSSDANGFDLNCSGGSGRQHIYWNDSSAGTFFKIGSQTTGVHLYKKVANP